MSMENLRGREGEGEGEASPELKSYAETLKGQVENLMKGLREQLKGLGEAGRSLMNTLNTEGRKFELVAAGLAMGLGACTVENRPQVESAINEYCRGERVTVTVYPEDREDLENIISDLEASGNCIVRRPERTRAVPGEDSQVSYETGEGGYVLEMVTPGSEEEDRLSLGSKE